MSLWITFVRVKFLTPYGSSGHGYERLKTPISERSPIPQACGKVVDNVDFYS